MKFSDKLFPSVGIGVFKMSAKPPDQALDTEIMVLQVPGAAVVTNGVGVVGGTSSKENHIF